MADVETRPNLGVPGDFNSPDDLDGQIENVIYRIQNNSDEPVPA